MRNALAILILLGAASAQVIQVAGGSSTIYEGTGAQTTLFFPSSTAIISGGVAEGHAGFSIGDTFKADGLNVTVGDHGFNGALDALGSVSLFERGLFAERSGVGGFIGSTGVGYGTPFFQTMTAQHIGLGFFAQRKFGKWKLATVDSLSGGTHTAAGSVAFTSAIFKLTAAGGLLASKPTAAGQLDFHPIRSVRLLGSQQTLVFRGQQSTVDSGSLFAGLGHFSSNVGAFRGVSATGPMVGVNGGIGVNVGPISEQSGWFNSNGHSVLFHAVTENARHWSLTQTVSQSRGQTSVSGGGTYHTNRFAVGVQQGIGFSPTSGFEHTTSITLTLRVRDSAINLGANEVAGVTRYSASATDFTHGPMAGSTTAGVHQFHQGGKYVVKGKVRNPNGQPISGVAVALAAVVVYSAEDGDFSMHTRAKQVTVTVLPEDFIVPGRWRTVSAPNVATADALVEITVERVQ